MKYMYTLLCGSLLAVLFLAGVCLESRAQTSVKKFKIEYRDQPWDKVLEWLVDQTGMPLISTLRPTGTVNFVAPKDKDGKPLEYTLPEVIDILNELMQAQKYHLLRRQASYTIVSADEKIPPELLMRVTRDDLKHFGKTEIVSLVQPLEVFNADEFAPEVKKMMGPFGEVVVISRANSLLLQDTVGNLNVILKFIDDTEKNEKVAAQTYVHKCIWIRAKEAETKLREAIGETREEVQVKTSDQSRPSFFGRPQETPKPTLRSRITTIAADERTNQVFISGPADKIARAKEILKRLDVQQPPQTTPLPQGAPFIKYHNVPGGADNFVKTVSEIHKTSATFKIWVVNPGTVGVYGGPAEHAEIEFQIANFPKVTSVTEKIALNNLDATRTAETLKGIFPDSKLGSPYIEADTLTNSLIIKGSKEQLTDVKNVINALGEVQGTGTMRIIGLDKGSAVTLAEALERLLPQLRANPVRIILPGHDHGSEPKKKPELKPVLPNDCDPNEQQHNGRDPEAKPDVQLIDPQKKNGNGKKQTKLPGDPKAVVTVMAFGNKLIVTSEDPAALALVSEVVRLLTQTQAGEGDFAVIRLRYANAVEAAKVLDQIFNGTRSSGGRGQSGSPLDIGRMIEGLNPMNFLSRFAAPGAQAPNNPSPERIRVVADPQTNSLLVKATPLDLLTIRSLLDKAIDNNETESEAIPRTWVIGPLKHCNATELANLISNVYRENMNNNPRGFGAMTSFSPFGGGSRSAPPNTNDRVTLSLGVDERTNSLVVSCPTAMYEDIKNLVAQMEKAAADSTTTIKVIPLKGIDPTLVEQAINAIAGRSSTSSTSGFRRPGDSSTPGGFSPGGFSPGGFSPGGFSPGGFSPGGFTPGGFTPGGFQRPFTFPTSGGMDGGGGRSGRTFGSGGSGRTRGRGEGYESRGPDFFGHTVKDDQLAFVLYDPQHPLADLSAHASLTGSFEEQQSPPNSPPTGRRVGEAVALAQPELEGGSQPPLLPGTAGSEALRGPRTSVTAEALEQLGVIILRGNNKADVEEIVRVIEYIQRLGSAADIQIELVPLEQGDATSVAAILTQLFSRVIIGPTSTVLVTGGGQRPAAVPVTPGPTPGQQQQPVIAAQVGTGSIVLLPVPRLNAILLAAPKGRIDDMRREIARLDVATTARAVSFPLQRASAARVATLITQFYGQRYPNETSAQNQVRVTYDDGINTVFVQASPADLAEIRELITRIDTTSPSARSDLRIVRLNNAVADELAAILTRAISEGTTVTTAAAPGIFPQQPTGLLPGQPGVGPAQFGQPGVAGVTARTGLVTKTSTLRFFTTNRDNGKLVETGILEDVRINTDPRTNSLIIAAPEKTMQLILALIRDLDVPPTARAEINIFTLKKADAQLVANHLQQLFLGAGARAGTQAIPGTQQVALPGQAGQLGTTAGRPLQLTIGDRTPEGAPLIDLRLSVDLLTNSIIVAGSRNDLDVIEAIIARLENFDPQQQRRSEAYRLKNAVAADVALAVNDFLTKQLQVYSKGGLLTTFQELLREVVVVAEPISNTLLVSASPPYFDEVMRVISALDQLPPQVMIQALIAEVTFNDTDEFGVEWGFQSPVLFDRGVLPTGVTVANSIDAAVPGFNFITTNPLGQATLAAPSTVGFQGINQLGVGRISPTQGVGGFVFSAASDSVNILVRALKVQGRLDVLSRPQIMTSDNQAARIHVGQDFPFITNSTTTVGVTAVPTVTNSIAYRPVGVELTVIPKINPDGTVIMRVIPSLSSVSPTSVDFGNNVFASAFNLQTVETTVVAQDGETVAIGGLITRREQKQENRIPWLGDLPGIGALFRFRQHNKLKTELIVILTPHIVRCKADADRILAEEARRIDWILGDVTRIHGVTGMEPVLHGPVVPHPGPSLAPYGILPPTPVPGGPTTPPTGEPLSAPRPLPATSPPPSAPVQNSMAPTAAPAVPSTFVGAGGGEGGPATVPVLNPAPQATPPTPLTPSYQGRVNGSPPVLQPQPTPGPGMPAPSAGTPTAVATPVMSSPVNPQQGRESQAWSPIRRN